MKFNAPDPTAPQWMAFLGSYVVPKKYIESGGLDNFLKKPVGTGPYKLAEYELNSRIVLERNDNYWGPKAKVARVTVEIIKDPSARVAAIQSGQADLTINVPVREVQRFQSEAGLCRRDRSDHPRDPAPGARRSGVCRQERPPCRASRHRQGGAVEGVLWRRRRAAFGAGDAGHARLSARFHLQVRPRTRQSACWRNPVSDRPSRRRSALPAPTASSPAITTSPAPSCRCGRRSASTPTCRSSSTPNISS